MDRNLELTLYKYRVPEGTFYVLKCNGSIAGYGQVGGQGIQNLSRLVNTVSTENMVGYLPLTSKHYGYSWTQLVNEL